jgi:hypothetical protein
MEQAFENRFLILITNVYHQNFLILWIQYTAKLDTVRFEPAKSFSSREPHLFGSYIEHSQHIS